MTSRYERFDDGMPDLEITAPRKPIRIPANERNALVAAIALERHRKEGDDFDVIHNEERLRYAP